LYFFLVILAVWNRLATYLWLSKPSKEGKFVTVNSREVFYRIKGHLKPVILIQTWVSGASFEWWEIQDQLAEFATVITYDRAGYGFSQATNDERSSEFIVQEMQAILDKGSCTRLRIQY